MSTNTPTLMCHKVKRDVEDTEVKRMLLKVPTAAESPGIYASCLWRKHAHGEACCTNALIWELM